jgi:hypothetical protein
MAEIKKSSIERRQSENRAGYFFDDGLDDDDSSYFFGFRPNTQHPSLNEDTERKKNATIVNLYWPFHRLLYDITATAQWYQRLPQKCTKKQAYVRERSDSQRLQHPSSSSPVSERKRRRIEMETPGLHPMQVKGL